VKATGEGEAADQTGGTGRGAVLHWRYTGTLWEETNAGLGESTGATGELIRHVWSGRIGEVINATDYGLAGDRNRELDRFLEEEVMGGSREGTE